ncbi:MAG TPA: hypothetical protein VF334_10945 [Polyangia bacterium]
MNVEFRRTGERRYTVIAHRRGRPPVEIGGPGFDAIMPHDLVHFIVESELGLEHGIFGFIAAGGDAGGSPHLVAGESARAAARRRNKAARRDRTMLRRGERDDGDRSERAGYVCMYEWHRRSRDPARRARAAEMADGVRVTLDGMRDDERRAFGAERIAAVCARMDELSARWSRLAIGESFLVEWTVRRNPRTTEHRSAMVE